jgi:hypothetical protein
MRIRPTKALFGISLALLIAICCVSSNAQSGRRQAKPAPAAPVPSPTPEPTPTPKAKNDDNEMVFLVATGSRDFSRAPYSFHEAATRGCAEQLGKRTSADVEVSQRELSRGEAIDKAKASETTYVVLVTLVEDVMNSSAGYAEFEVDYVVFAPRTAKVMASGRTYESSMRKGPVSVGKRGGMSLPTYREQILRKAGEDAADRIVKALHLNDPLPPRKTTS